MREAARVAAAVHVVAPATWGGRRKGAGRKKGERPRVWHRKRAPHCWRHPVHVTLRARPGLPSFVQQVVRELLKQLLHDQRRAPRAYREAFHVAHYSIQANHIHMIVEAVDSPGARAPACDASRALRAGVSGFAIAFARRLNRLLGRRGRVWDGRYHRHDPRAPPSATSS